MKMNGMFLIFFNMLYEEAGIGGVLLTNIFLKISQN